MKTLRYCRNCGSEEVVDKLDLGNIYPSNFVDGNNNLVPAPLVLAECMECGLVQLRHTLPLDSMYRQYWYRSSLNKSMVRALEDVVLNAVKRTKLLPLDLVLDIGCNDGIMLDFYPDDMIKMGFDPALNLREEAEKHCDTFVNDYFSSTAYLTYEWQKAKIITSIAMFYDLEDPNQFIMDVKEVLDPEGVWVIQFTDLLSMLQINAFDNVCHEHLEYYSLTTLYYMLQQHNLQIFDVEYNKVNGGSLRAYVRHKRNKVINGSVPKALWRERQYFQKFDDPLYEFSKRTMNIIEEVREHVITEWYRNHKVAVFGASTKGNTLLQVMGLSGKYIHHAAEINKDKFGLKTVGTNIPIISEEESLKSGVDLYLVLPWHFINNFVANNIDYLNQGGKFLVPMPEPAIITKDGWHDLKGKPLVPKEPL